MGSPDRPSHPGVRPLPTSSDGIITNLLATGHSSPIRLACRSSGNGRQRARGDLAPFRYRFFRKGGGKSSGKRPHSAKMRKNSETHQKQESEHALPGSIIAVVRRSVNGLCPCEPTASVGSDADVSAGIALTGAAGITQISASRRLGVGTTRTEGVSALARVVVFMRSTKAGKSAGNWM